MGKQKQTEKVPQWVRDLITQRQRQLFKERQHSEKDEKVQVDDNVYLLNPFSQDEVEAIRNGVWKLREEASLAAARDNRKRREAGHFIPYSGFSTKDDFFETHLRQLLQMSLSRQEMQEAVVKHYGWGKWSEDPWGDFPKFCKWMNSISDDERGVWAINSTFGGRVYFTGWIFRHLSQYDYSKITEEDFLPWIGVGAENFLWVKSYTGWDYFQKHYPDEPLPVRFINEQIIKVYLTCPFSGFRWFINSIYLWYFALKEFRERTKGHPELEGFLDYHTATDTQIAELCRKLAPKGYQPLDENQAWQKLEQSLKKRLGWTALKYNDIYPIESELEDGLLKESYVAAQEGLLEGVTYWKSKAAQATIAGLKGQLGNSLLRIVKNNFIDATREEKRHQTRQLLERDYLGEGLTLLQSDGSSIKIKSQKNRIDEEGEAPPLFEQIPAPQGYQEEATEPIDLKKLGFCKDELTPRELLLLDEVSDAAGKGYTKDSKEGLSLRQYWGKDYDRKMKMLKRLEAKRKKP